MEVPFIAVANRHDPVLPQTLTLQTAVLRTSPVELSTWFQAVPLKFSGIAHKGSPLTVGVPPMQVGRFDTVKAVVVNETLDDRVVVALPVSGEIEM